MLFRAETEIMLTTEAAVEELFGTSPDVKLEPAARPASITREQLLKDPWVKHIITAL